MEKILCLIYIYICSSMIPLIVVKLNRRLGNKKTFDNILLQKNILSLFFRDLIFFTLIIISFIFIFALSYAIQIAWPKNPFVESGLVSSIIFVCAGNLMHFFYNKVRLIVTRVCGKEKLMRIGENSRTWAFITACVFYINIGTLNTTKYNLELISLSALSIILGKFFWVDTSKRNIKNLLLNFFTLPYMITILYAIVFAATLAAPAVKHIDRSVAGFTMVAGFLSFLGIIIIQYRHEFKSLFK